jgi:ABC-type sugar transport system ATPase subunit
MNVYQNIAYGLEARNVARQVIQERVPQAATMLGLGDMLQRSIVDLSGGEQQRVALARAMVKDADAYLFDEPLSNLDPKLRHQARRDILAMHRAKRKPSLYVTHDQNEAFGMADRIAVMAQGRLLQVGSAEQLLHEPANMYVAGFIGSPPMNLLKAEVQHQDGQYHVVAPDLRVALPARWGQALARYGKVPVVLGIRPDALTIARQLEVSGNGQSQALVAEVEDLEELVGETVAVLKLGPSIQLTALFQDDGSADVQVGEALRVELDLDRISLFDPDSQQAL